MFSAETTSVMVKISSPAEGTNSGSALRSMTVFFVCRTQTKGFQIGK